MKRKVKIILVIIGLMLLAGGYYGYQIYKVISGSEPLSGKQEGIPEVKSSLSGVNRGVADWPNWRGVNYDGKSTVTGIKTDWTKGLEKLWSLNYLCQDKSTASWSAPVIQGNRMIVPGRDETNDLIFCINSETGELIWQGSYPAVSATSHGPGPRATPYISDDKVYTFGRSGDLVCWNLEDGKLLWRRNVKDEGGAEPTWGFSSTPLVYGNLVIVQGGGSALAIAYNKLTGEVIWKSLSGDSGYSAAIPMVLENETKLLIYHGKGLSCLNPEDGKELWFVSWPTEYGVNATTPIVSNDTIFHTSGYKMGCQALKVTKRDYKVLWKNKAMEAQHSDPVLIDGYIYGYSGESFRNKGEFKCIELSTGKEMWSTNKMGQGTTAFADNHLICQDLKGNLFLVKPDPSEYKLTGKIEASEERKHPAWTVPVIANGKLYIRYLQQLECYGLN